MRFVARLLILSLMFRCALPAIPGIVFHGHLSNALVMALAFSVLFWLIDRLALLIGTIVTVTTFGLALLWLVPFWIVGFWIVPTLALKLVALVMPLNLSISGWLPAIWGGLMLLGINIIVGRLGK
jgi:hypothetical protein